MLQPGRTLTRREALCISFAFHLVLASLIARIDIKKETGLPVPKSPRIQFDLVVEKAVKFKKDSNSDAFTNQDHSEQNEDRLDPSASPTNGRSASETGNTTLQRDKLLAASLSVLEEMVSPFNLMAQQLPPDRVGAFAPVQGFAPDTKSTKDALNSGLLKVAGFGRGNCPPERNFHLLPFGRKPDYHAEMIEAVTFMDNASSYEHIVRAARRFEEVSRHHKDRWVAHFWTSYGYSLAALILTRAGKSDKYFELISAAQTYCDKALRTGPAKSVGDLAELSALQANIFRVQQHFARKIHNADDERKYRQRFFDALAKGENYRAENPLVRMLTALTGLGKAGAKDAANAMAVSFEKLEDRRHENRTTPRWTRQWLTFWLTEYDLKPHRTGTW